MVYCNRRNRRIIIHHITCSYIQVQENIHGNLNGEWLGPFDKYETALTRAQAQEPLYGAVASNCGHCLRNH